MATMEKLPQMPPPSMALLPTACPQPWIHHAPPHCCGLTLARRGPATRCSPQEGLADGAFPPSDLAALRRPRSGYGSSAHLGVCGRRRGWIWSVVVGRARRLATPCERLELSGRAPSGHGAQDAAPCLSGSTAMRVNHGFCLLLTLIIPNPKKNRNENCKYLFNEFLDMKNWKERIRKLNRKKSRFYLTDIKGALQ